MKNIQDIIKKKVSHKESGERRKLDEKTIARVFLEAAKEEVKNLAGEDIREIKMKEKILYIKTVHPVISSELFMRKEKILEKLNEIAGGKEVEQIII